MEASWWSSWYPPHRECPGVGAEQPHPSVQGFRGPAGAGRPAGFCGPVRVLRGFLFLLPMLWSTNGAAAEVAAGGVKERPGSRLRGVLDAGAVAGPLRIGRPRALVGGRLVGPVRKPVPLPREACTHG